ncbi:MAG: hypothetical protein J6T10_19220 [Methanobrevibacter sp.]|nr:hypothetical protein [Methanobrevibacter sp.]
MALMITQDHLQDAFYNVRSYSPQTIFEQMGGEAYFGEYSEDVLREITVTQQYDPHAYITQWVGKDPEVTAEWAYQNAAARSQATAMYDIEPVFEEGTQNVVSAQTKVMPQTTTGAGTVKPGALSGKIPLATLAGGIAIGAGVGLKEVAEHPKFWNDLSNAVFNDLKSPDVLTYKPLRETETANVIWREMQDGSIQAYCDKRDADNIIKALYQMDAFNVADHINQEVTTAGDQDVPLGQLTEGFVNLTLQNTGTASPYVSVLYDQGLLRYPGTTVTYTRTLKNTDNGYANVQTWFYNIPQGEMTVLGTAPNGLYVNATDEQKLGNFTANINPDGTVLNFSFTDGVAETVVPIGSQTTMSDPLITCYVTNLGSDFVAKNPAVIYNGTDLLPPENIDDFWDTFALWLANAFVDRSYNPYTNNYVDTTYLPFTAPDKNWQIEPFTGDQQGVWSGIYDFVSPFSDPTTTPVNNPSPWIYQSLFNQGSPDIKIPDSTPWTVNPSFPQIGLNPFGASPTIVAPSSGVSSGSKLYSVYNPSQANVDALGAYLWNSSIIDTISKFFQNNPLDAIISLHMIYASPSTGSNKNIVLGYLDSGVSSPTVTSQYVDISCGDVQVSEAYGNALDYTGVSIQVFLPFIGYRTLRTKEIMNSRLEIDYKVDVYTGTCIAMLYAIRPNLRQLLYTFEGNCSVQIPLTASDRTRLISGLVTAGVSAFTGNPAGVVGGIASIKQDVQRSGGFSGNAGAMGCKKPYLIITRAVDTQPTGYNSQYGYPNNKLGYLVNFKGFTRCKSVHVDIPTATESELIEIEAMLKEGIII